LFLVVFFFFVLFLFVSVMLSWLFLGFIQSFLNEPPLFERGVVSSELGDKIPLTQSELT